MGDFCRSLAQTWGNVGDNSFICSIQGWLQSFGAVAMGLWFATIAAVCISIKKMSGWWKKKTQHQIKRLQQKLVVIVAVFAVICASIPWNYYHYSGGWCWISAETTTGHALRYACYYGILIACLLFTIIVYCELFRIVRQENKLIEQEEKEEAESRNVSDDETTVTRSETVQVAPSKMDTKKRQKRMFDQMKYYPWALIIGQGPGAIRRIIELITNGHAPFWLVVIHAICSGLFGFITAVIYGTKTWQIYRYKCRSCLGVKPSMNKTVKTVEMDSDQVDNNINGSSNGNDEETGQTHVTN
mmetsp:Transcript_66610/g.59760  ORF Transcript_66610/g.59760 Transcript_66610/m.59760 type:complete len:300 (-) Transcript_66610:100-999(-)